MKPIRQLVFVVLASASALLLCVSLNCTVIRAQDTPQNQPRAAEENAYQAARNEKDAQARIKLLDDFVAAYPDSPLLRNAYRDEYMTYFSLGNYPETANYADKFLAFGEKNDSADRLQALMTRAGLFWRAASMPSSERRNLIQPRKRPPHRDWTHSPNFRARLTACGPGLAAQNGKACSRFSILPP